MGGSGEPANRCKQTTEAEPMACLRKAGAEGEEGKRPGPQDQKPRVGQGLTLVHVTVISTKLSNGFQKGQFRLDSRKSIIF